jgi:RNA polymerase sigma-54 factor
MASQSLNQTQNQTQAQIQTQTLSPQQVLVVRLLELPVSELEQRIHTELDSNEALEEKDPEGRSDESEWDGEEKDANDMDEGSDNSTSSVVDNILGDYRSEDDVPDYMIPQGAADSTVPDGIDYAAPVSFNDLLESQVGEQDITDHQRTLLRYLIGSLDDDGLLKKNLSHIVEELYVDFNVETNVKELEEMLAVLQTFDPTGIGARNLQECLLLQLQHQNPSTVRDNALAIIQRSYDDLVNHRWDKICQRLGITKEALDAAFEHIRHLNPRPGTAAGEAVAHAASRIIPDFIVDTDDEGNVSVALNNGDLPQLRVSRSYSDLLRDYSNGKVQMNRSEKEALAYTKMKVDKAQGFIDAIRQRQHTLLVTMQAIVDMQMPYFRTGDESQLRPMILKDVAQRTGLDISTISRVSGSKFVQTNYGVFPLRFFFGDSFTTSEGTEISTRQIRQILKECIEGEDKNSPLSDDALAAMLKEKGFPIARRTVAKYREQLGIPVARLRR